MSGTSARTTFPWQETRTRLETLAARHALHLADDRKALLALDESGVVVARLIPPLLFPITADHATAADYLAALPADPGRHAVLLLRAGAAALGVWQDDTLEHHKVIKKYVVRGHGKAQTTWLKTRGKSRYGSRLRLQNARSLLQDVSERLADWRGLDQGFAQLLYQCAERQWAEFLRTEPPPPLADLRLTWLPLSTHEPGFEELLRVRRIAGRGALEETP